MPALTSLGLLIVLHSGHFASMARILSVPVARHVLQYFVDLRSSYFSVFQPCDDVTDQIDGPSLHHFSQFAHQRPSMPLRCLRSGCILYRFHCRSRCCR
uniref:Secreted protein n=1 Tax=Panagrellus redivivus TaxID=6233 RepID=A0A7E4W6F2_PANRE